MTIHLLITLAADFLEDQNLLAFEVFQDGGLNVCAGDVAM